MHVYFTGSSVLGIEKGEADLSRRAPRYLMQGLSFREYLAIEHGHVFNPYSLPEIIENKASIPGVDHPLPLFQNTYVGVIALLVRIRIFLLSLIMLLVEL